jgi:hypothetical protein
MSPVGTLVQIIDQTAFSLATSRRKENCGAWGPRRLGARDHRDRRDHVPGRWGRPGAARPPGPPSDHYFYESRDPRKKKGSRARLARIRCAPRAVGASSALPRSRDHGPDGPDGPAARFGASTARLGFGPSSTGSAACLAGPRRRRSVSLPGPSRLMVPGWRWRSAGFRIAAVSRSLLRAGSSAPSTPRSTSPCCAAPGRPPAPRARSRTGRAFNRREARRGGDPTCRSSRRRGSPLRGVGYCRGSRSTGEGGLRRGFKHCGERPASTAEIIVAFCAACFSFHFCTE